MSELPRNSWFVDYQQIPSKGITTGRDPAVRVRLFVPEDFRSASVLDLGCNLGSLSFASIAFGARSVIGVDFDRDVIAKARSLVTTESISFSVEDIDSPAFWRSIDPVDTVLFLSIFLTRELKNKYAILANACAKAKRCLYFEGHANETQGYRVCDYVRDICLFSGFENVEYLGNSESPGLRPLIRCTRKPLTFLDAVPAILRSTERYNKIVVVGKSAVGKSDLFKAVTAGIESHTHTFMDDVPPPHGQSKFVLFDWRGLEYVPDADCVFIVTCDESERLRRIEAQPYKDLLLRTAPGQIKNAKAIYTVKT